METRLKINKTAKILKKIKTLALSWCYFLQPFSLPLILILLLVVGGNLFISQLGLPVHPYLIRRSLAMAGTGLLLFGPSVMLRGKIRYLYLLITASLASFILVTQFLYHSYSKGFLQISALFYAKGGITTFSTARHFLDYRLLFFAIGPLLAVFAWILSRRPAFKEPVLSLRQKTASIAIILIFSTVSYGFLFFREFQETGDLSKIYKYSQVYDINELIAKIGILNFTLGDALAYGLASSKVSAADKDFVQAFASELKTPAPGKSFGLLKKRNLILIQVESLENAVIGQKINGQEITPNLNRLSKQGLYFSNYYAPIGPGTTADAEFMTLNSFYSLPDRVAFIQYAYNRYAALPSLLAQNGYTAYSFHGDVSSFWNRANIYPRLGYAKWFDRADYSVTRDVGAFGLGDQDFFSQSIPKLKSLPEPFMASLITLSSHTPFVLPADLVTLDIPASTTLDWLQVHYLESLHYTDQAIGLFISQLKEAGLYDDSLILIYGDHGSFTGIAGALGAGNCVFPDLEETQVPLILLAPGTSLKGERKAPASHLDLYPSIAGLLGISPPAEIFGHDIIDGNSAVAVSRNLVSGTIKSFVSRNLAYKSSTSGNFRDGICLEMPGKKALDPEACRKAYDEETEAVKASDLMIKGNLIEEKTNQTPDK